VSCRGGKGNGTQDHRPAPVAEAERTDAKTNDKTEKRPEGLDATPENTDGDATPGSGMLPDGEDGDATGG
jgi:hypothetical protein